MLDAGIDLFGTEATRNALDGIKQAVDAVGVAARSRSGDMATMPESFSRAYSEQREAIIAAIGVAIEAMRRDVLPD